MHAAPDPHRFNLAARRFAAFFDELRATYLERDDLLTQLALGILAREHVLVAGPPGTAKSEVTAAVLARIVDEETGKPSLYARQFTESTVQTDLIGPIDFKTLMETGRTEHFTEEGMLGATHAFLDEVFDGRDMLLRSALNVLHERELKQGGRITRGRIECAVMTSNRYIADVLDGSRDTLLAFVDRIAFINFVPRGFADPSHLGVVIEKHAGGIGRARFNNPLTLQDVDVLQEAVDSVIVPSGVCHALARLLDLLDVEMAAAVRAVPGFSPTRYLSTRTAVRAGRILRAIAVLDRITAHPERPFEVAHDDLRGLRYNLLLCGPSPADAAARLERETEPSERRQLEILRTEREVFERCLTRVPPPVPPAATPYGFSQRMSAALAGTDVRNIIEVVSELRSGSIAGTDDSTRRQIDTLLRNLLDRALAAGFSATGAKPLEIEEMQEVADLVEQVDAGKRAVARWVRGRALTLVCERAAAAAGPDAAPATLEALLLESNEALQQIELAARRRHELVSRGADMADGATVDAAWTRALDRAAETQRWLADAVLRVAVEEAHGAVAAGDLEAVLGALRSVWQHLDEVGARLDVLGVRGAHVKEQVARERLAPLVRAVLSRDAAPAPSGITGRVETLRRSMAEAGLADAVPTDTVMDWAAGVLARHEPSRPKMPTSFSLAAYRAWFTDDPTSAAHTLVELAVKLVPRAAAKDPSAVLAKAHGLIRALPENLRERLAARDLARADAAVSFVEMWWDSLRPKGTDPANAVADLERIVGSGLLRALREESAALRPIWDTRLLVDLFPDRADVVQGLQARADGVDRACASHITELLGRRATAEWSRALEPERA